MNYILKISLAAFIAVSLISCGAAKDKKGSIGDMKTKLEKLKKEKNKPNRLILCHEFKQETKCLAPVEKRTFCIDKYEYPNQIYKVPIKPRFFNLLIMTAPFVNAIEHINKNYYVDDYTTENVKTVKPCNKEKEVGK